MNQDNASSLGILVFSVTLAVIGWIQNHAMMRHGLFAAATWGVEILALRMLRDGDYLTADQARLLNGAYAWMVMVVLVTFGRVGGAGADGPGVGRRLAAR